MKKLINIAIILLLLISSNLFSQSLCFKATSYRFGDALKLDSVRIIGVNNGFDLTTKDTCILKKLFTGVNDEPVINSINNPINISFISQYEIAISINTNNLGNTHGQLKIINYLGDELFSKNIDNSSEKINFDFKTHGVYYVYYNYGDKFSVKKLLINGLNNFVSSNESGYYPSGIVILQTNLYNFIAYKKGYRPDTLSSVDIDSVSVLNFVMLDNSKYNFRSGSISINNLALNYQVNYSSLVHQGSGSSSTSYDTVNKSFTLDHISCIDSVDCSVSGFAVLKTCGDVTNKDSLLNFCCTYNTHKIDKYSCNESHISIIINDIDSMLSSVTWTIYKNAYKNIYNPPYSNCYESKDDYIDIELQNLPYIIDNDSLKVNINTDIINYIVKIFDQENWENAPSPGYTSTGDNFLINIIDTSQATIVIELDP